MRNHDGCWRYEGGQLCWIGIAAGVDGAGYVNVDAFFDGSDFCLLTILILDGDGRIDFEGEVQWCGLELLAKRPSLAPLAEG